MSETRAVIIIHYKNIENTAQALASVYASKPRQYLQPIVVNHSSDPNALDGLKQQYGKWLHVETPAENLGFTGGNNLGIKVALEQYDAKTIFLLNDDATVAPDTFKVLDSSLHALSRVGMVVPKIYFSPGHEFHPGYEKTERGRVLWYAGGVIDWKELYGSHRGVDEVDYGQYDQVEDTPFATACCIALKPAALKKNGAFDDKYFLYLEDLDLSQRFKRAKWRVLYDPRAIAWHQNAGSSGSGSDLHQYYQTRNRLLFGWRYAPLRTKLFLIKHSLLQLRSGNSALRQAILDAVTQRYGKRLRYHTTA